jgi:hypothetical protein
MSPQNSRALDVSAAQRSMGGLQLGAGDVRTTLSGGDRN